MLLLFVIDCSLALLVAFVYYVFIDCSFKEEDGKEEENK